MDNSNNPNNPNNPFNPQNIQPVAGNTPPMPPQDINPFNQTTPQPQNIPSSPPSATPVWGQPQENQAPTFSQPEPSQTRPEPISSPWDNLQKAPPIQTSQIEPQPSPLSSVQPDLSANPQMYPQNPVFETQPPSQFNPVQPEPAPLSQPPFQNQPSSQPQPGQTWPEPAVQPLSTFTPPSQDTQSNPSPLDNPLGAPIQPPPIDGSDQANPPAWAPTSQTAAEDTPSAPTDLSHLISNNNPQEQPQPATETLIVPNTAAPEVPNLPSEERKGIPKWLIGIGIGLLLLVSGASAYFILGIGKTPETASLPATTEEETAQIKPPPPVATPVPQPTPQDTGSSSFGELGGAQQATSAADLIKQRKQQGQ